jgi:hypothetical protein
MSEGKVSEPEMTLEKMCAGARTKSGAVLLETFLP